MENHNAHSHDAHEESHGSLKSYVIGFILSIVLTIIPLVFVLNHMMGKTATLVLIFAMAVLQLIVQLFFFMHLREEKEPRWNVLALIMGLIIVITIVIGSIWIMGNNVIG